MRNCSSSTTKSRWNTPRSMWRWLQPTGLPKSGTRFTSIGRRKEPWRKRLKSRKIGPSNSPSTSKIDTTIWSRMASIFPLSVKNSLTICLAKACPPPPNPKCLEINSHNSQNSQNSHQSLSRDHHKIVKNDKFKYIKHISWCKWFWTVWVWDGWDWLRRL